LSERAESLCRRLPNNTLAELWFRHAAGLLLSRRVILHRSINVAHRAYAWAAACWG